MVLITILIRSFWYQEESCIGWNGSFRQVYRWLKVWYDRSGMQAQNAGLKNPGEIWIPIGNREVKHSLCASPDRIRSSCALRTAKLRKWREWLWWIRCYSLIPLWSYGNLLDCWGWGLLLTLVLNFASGRFPRLQWLVMICQIHI